MSTASKPAVLLLSADRRELRHWAAALEPVAARVWQSLDAMRRDDDCGAHPLVVVTDGIDDTARDPRLAFLAEAEFGLVRLGSGDSSDFALALGNLGADKRATAAIEVELPVDVSARELGLVCRLLGEIVALRRALRASDRQRTTLAEQALGDALTGLPNRRAWDEALLARISTAPPAAHSFVLAIFDLDHFKEVNNRGGLVLGDAVLRAAGAALVDSIRRHDFAARLGGDEFGVILAELPAESAESVIARLRQEIALSTGRETTPAVTASAGYVHVHAPAALAHLSRLDQVIFSTADAALRQAKLAGRDRAVAASLTEP